jgi:hypothetical protein
MRVAQLPQKPQQRQDFEQFLHEHSPLQSTVSIGSARGGGVDSAGACIELTRCGPTSRSFDRQRGPVPPNQDGIVPAAVKTGPLCRLAIFMYASGQQQGGRHGEIETMERARLLEGLEAQPGDSLLALIGMVRRDPRPHKIDLGVGVYRDPAGGTPILRAVKGAERILNETQETKAYLGGEGDVRFVELMREMVFGPSAGSDPRFVGLQTPGGCGALRLGAELIYRANPRARIFVGQPTWPNHVPLIGSVGLEIVETPFYDRGDCCVRFDEMMAALDQARPGDLVLVHGCCHNPTGADLSPTSGRRWPISSAAAASFLSWTSLIRGSATGWSRMRAAPGCWWKRPTRRSSPIRTTRISASTATASARSTSRRRPRTSRRSLIQTCW